MKLKIFSIEEHDTHYTVHCGLDRGNLGTIHHLVVVDKDKSPEEILSECIKTLKEAHKDLFPPKQPKNPEVKALEGHEEVIE